MCTLQYATTASMAKLTRYTNFEKLKLDNKSGSTASAGSGKKISELEEFIKLLRSRLLAGKESKHPKTSNGQ